MSDTEVKKYSSKNYKSDGKYRLWKCAVCGQLVVSQIPPNQCPKCSKKDEIWILLKVIEYDGKLYSDTIYPLREWKCAICGEVVKAPLPPVECPKCKGKLEIWMEIK